MRYINILFCFLLCFVCMSAGAQTYSILIKGGHVIDAKNNINEVMDVAIKDNKIAKVGKDISESEAAKVINANGFYVTPGLIDIHVHAFVGNEAKMFADGHSSVMPDDYSFRAGITTVVDCGTSGWRNFPVFKKNVIDQSKTRVLAFLNIFGSGMIGSPQEQNMNDLDIQKAIDEIHQFPDVIVGIKIGHYSGSDWSPFDKALEVGRITDRPIIIEAHLPNLPLEGILERMRPGDIYSQAFKHTTKDRISIIDDNGKAHPYVVRAWKKGVLFDVGHGGVSFQYSTAVPAYKQGILPNSFGSDMHSNSINGGMKDMLNIMSKYLNMGMNLNDVIARATWMSAASIKRNDLGQLGEGSVADVAVIKIVPGQFGFIDASNEVMEGTRKLECEMTIRNGKIAYDLNGIGGIKMKTSE